MQVDVESNRIREFEQVENTSVNLKQKTKKKKHVCIRGSWLDGFCWIFNVEKWNICFYLNFFFFIFICITATNTHTGQGWATKRWSQHPNICTFDKRTMRFAIWQRQKHHLDPCVLPWLVFLFPMVLACVDLSDEHVSPLSFAASNHCQGGVISTKQETDFVLFFSFFLFCLLLVGHKASRSEVSSDCMLDLFGVFFLFLSWRYVTLMRVCLSDWRKQCGGSDYFMMFSVKLGNLMTHLPKHPRLDIWYDPSFCLFAWRKLFPKLQWLWFSWLPAMYRCMCYVIETTFSICAWYILWGWPDSQMGFFS